MNLPLDFLRIIQNELGQNDSADLEKSITRSSIPTSIRFNSKKFNIDQELESIPWCSSGYYLAERPSFTLDPCFHAGAYYVQEASSMFLEQGIKQYISGDVIGLDLCAAPGGKSTLVKSLLSDSSLLVSNEYVRSRAFVLSENMMKWGDPNYIVCNNKPKDIGSLKNLFDFILIDAPCSGEGMFRKDPKAIEEWSLTNVARCRQRQEEIIKDVWDALKPDGYIFYSTCTYNTIENEEIVSFLQDLGCEVLSLNIDDNWNIVSKPVGKGEVYHFYPHKVKGEGFFFSVLKKKKYEDSIHTRPAFKTKKKVLSTDIDLLKYIQNSREFELVNQNNEFYAIPSFFVEAYELLSQHLKIISTGIKIGQIKGRDFIPSQSLALSNNINLNNFEILEIDKDMAISYLRCESLNLANISKGYVLLRYQGLNLGFVKNIGTRANNLYPHEWRIRNKNSLLS